MITHSGSYQGQGLRIGIVVSRFNDLVTKSLLAGAVDTLTRQGVSPNRIEVVWVPGAFELPAAAQRLLSRRGKRLDGLVALGTVIRGETTHYEYVASAAATGLAQVGLSLGVPVAFGILTTETLDQALQRAGGKMGNKGSDAALTVLELIRLFKRLGR